MWRSTSGGILWLEPYGGRTCLIKLGSASVFVDTIQQLGATSGHLLKACAAAVLVAGEPHMTDANPFNKPQVVKRTQDQPI